MSHRCSSPWINHHLHLHLDGGEGHDDVGLRPPPPAPSSFESTDDHFLSEFFGPLTPDFSAQPQPTAAPETAVLSNASLISSGGGGGGEEEEVEVEVESRGFACREKRPTASTTTSDAKRSIQVDGENRGPPHKKKRNRTTEMHNMTERKRRDNIKRKLKALQEIIPNSYKLDRASLLDETITYVKALQLQMQITQASCMCHSPCMSPGGAMHCLRMPHFSPFSHMGTGYGMGMTGTSRPVHSPIMSMPSPMVATSMVPMPGFSSILTYSPLSQLPMPFISLPEYSPTGLPPIPSPPVLRPGPFGSHLGESSSESEAKCTRTEFQQVLTENVSFDVRGKKSMKLRAIENKNVIGDGRVDYDESSC